MIRDVVQSHLLQILSLVAMELPVAVNSSNSNNSGNWETEDIRYAMVEVLKNIPDVHLRDSLLGQYDGHREDPNITDLRCCKVGCERSSMEGRAFRSRSWKILGRTTVW
jgi:glucose-6-phosphate 1-dehydrogenase